MAIASTPSIAPETANEIDDALANEWLSARQANLRDPFGHGRDRQPFDLLDVSSSDRSFHGTPSLGMQ